MFLICHLIMVLSQHFNIIKYIPTLINIPTHIQAALAFNLSLILQGQASSMDYHKLPPYPHPLVLT